MLIPIVPTFVRSFQEAVSSPLTTATALSATRTSVMKILPAAILATGSRIKIRVRAHPTGAFTLAGAYIGLSATTGNAWNFATTPTQITWDNGQTSKTVAAGLEAESDEVAFEVSGAAAITVAFNVASGSRLHYASGLGASRPGYVKNSVQEAGSTSKGASYTSVAGRSEFLESLWVA
jgi:hypothetical protein